MSARVALAFLVFGVPLTAAGQRITITPVAGTYIGLTRQWEAYFINDCYRPPCPPNGRGRGGILPSPFLGFTLSPQTNAIAFEGSLVGVLTRSGTSTLLDGDSTWRVTGRTVAITTVTALRVTLTRPLGLDRSVVFGAGGALLINHEELALHAKANETFVAASFSAKLRSPATRRSRLELGAVSSIYRINQRLQHDIMLSIGLGLAKRAPVAAPLD